MRIDFKGRLSDEPEIRAGFVGCGSHSWRNLYPTFHFAPVRLVATCDLDAAKAREFASRLGAGGAYADYREMLASEELDAVFVCTGYDDRGRPLYPRIARDCMEAGCHVWIEKPPAASSAEIDSMSEVSKRTGRHVMVGLKKMFFPANEKAKELVSRDDFGNVSLGMLQYPQYIPTAGEFARYMGGERVGAVVSFLDHLCHPVSLMLYLFGMPGALVYERSANGAGAATFTYEAGPVVSMAFTKGASINGGMESTVIVSDSGRHVTVENCTRVKYHRSPALSYGESPSFFEGDTESATAVWEPEFSLGNLYNKGLFLLGYYGEVNEFARAVLEGRAPAKGTLEQARQATRIFEAFASGPGPGQRVEL